MTNIPQFIIRPNGEISRFFLEHGINNFKDAAFFVRSLPYGRNTDRANWRLVMSELKGTCSTKHALLAQLASEQSQPVQLVVGIYEMNGQNTPGVEEVLGRYGLDSVPEAHCYLKVGGIRLDFTRSVPAEQIVLSVILYEEPILPEQIGEYKVQLHQEFIRKWLFKKGRNPEEWEMIWRIREECIRALSTNQE